MLRIFSFLLLAALSSSACSAASSELEQLTAKRYKIVSSIKRLPPEVMAFISERNIGEISDVGGKFWASDACCFPNQPPSRRLLLAGYNRNFIYVYYEQGGRGLTLHFVAFKRDNGNASLIYHSRFGNHQRVRTQKQLFSFLFTNQPLDESEQIENNSY
jgi:hypothetical protein